MHTVLFYINIKNIKAIQKNNCENWYSAKNFCKEDKYILTKKLK